MKINYLSRKEQIVTTTISLIHEVGIQNVSMKEIGRREGVSEASLYKHFKSKEEILSGVMEYYEKYDRHILATLKSNESSAVDNIIRYFCIYAEYYGNYKEITSLGKAYYTLSYNAILEQRAKQNVKLKTQFLTELLIKGQESKELELPLLPEHLAYVLLGTFDRIIYMWQLADYSFFLRDKVETIMTVILEPYVKVRNKSAAAEEKKVRI